MSEEGTDLEAFERRKDKVRELWDDGERDLRKIAGNAGISVREARRVLVESNRTTWEGEYAPLRIADICAKDLDDTCIFYAEILSVQGGLSLPSRVSGVCKRCGAGDPQGVPVDPREFLFLPPKEQKARLEFVALRAAQEAGCKCKKSWTEYQASVVKAVDYSVLTVGDIPEETRFAMYFTDIRRKLHLIGPPPPLGGCAKFIGTVKRDPGTGELVIISEDFQELESLPAATKLDAQTKKQLEEIGRMPLEMLRNQIAPDMVGSPLVQESRLLVLASPLRIRDVDNREIRGNIIEVVLGDTKTNKSESARDTAEAQGFGPFVQAENMGRTGLTYSLTERTTGGWDLVWGLLPRNHGKYIVIDGLEKWGPELMVQLRGVLADQKVQVDRVVHGRRPAAVRMTITLNPEKPVREYPFRCAAILGAKAFVKGPDISRIDFWHVLAEEDVSGEAIAHRVPEERPVDDKLFRTLIHWAWSRRPEQVKWTSEARELVKDQAAEMMKEYNCSSLPVVHRGFRDTLCRVSCAFAALRFSTTDGEDLLVQDKHVMEAAAWLRRMYDALELREYKKTVEGECIWTGGEFLSAAIEVGEDGLRILNVLTSGPLSAKDLAVKLGGEKAGYTEKAVQHQYDVLKKWGLIETRPGLGASLTSKGMEFFRILRLLRSSSPPNWGEVGKLAKLLPEIGEKKSPRVLEEYEIPPPETASSPEAPPSSSSSSASAEDHHKDGPDEQKDKGGSQP